MIKADPLWQGCHHLFGRFLFRLHVIDGYIFQGIPGGCFLQVHIQSGAVLIGVPVILVAMLQFGFSMTLVWVLGVYVIIQLLDSNVLTPMLFSKALNLDAFSILAAILIFGGLWGFWGVFFAIPLATLIKTIISRWPSVDTAPKKLSLKE